MKSNGALDAEGRRPLAIATLAQSLRVPRDYVKALLNHKDGDVTAIQAHTGACRNRVIGPVNAARFMTAASTLQRHARSAALNAPCVARPSRIGTRLGFLDIGSSPVQPGMPNDNPAQDASFQRAGATDFCHLQKTPRNEAVDFNLAGLSVGYSIHQQHTKKKDQIEHRKHEQATSRPSFLVIAPTYLP